MEELGGALSYWNGSGEEEGGAWWRDRRCKAATSELGLQTKHTHHTHACMFRYKRMRRKKRKREEEMLTSRRM